MNRCFLLLLFAILSLHYVGKAQGVFPQPVDVPITPNMAALYKSMDQPQGTFSGIPSISIPILTVKSGSINLPISLNYNGGGIKTEEIAGSAGLGWSLSIGGGNITRIMRGIPDDIPGVDRTGGYYYSTYKPSNFHADQGDATAVTVPAMNVARNKLDFEPDLYLYNFNGVSGSFFFDENKNIIQVEKTGLKITPVLGGYNGSFLGWVILDDKGQKFYFGTNSDKTRNVVDASDPSFPGQTPFADGSLIPVFISSWHLVEIDDINDRRLADLNYDANQIMYQTRGLEFRKLLLGGSCLAGEVGNLATITTVIANENQLREIIFKEGKISIELSDRLDLTGGKKINAIKLYDKANSLAKQYHFNFDYFVSPGNPNGISTEHLYKRLKLLSFSEYNLTSDDSITHKFSYNESPLPSRTSASMDYWGYYNGQPNPNTLIPNGTYSRSNDTIRYTIGADRRASEANNSSNILTKITFPTGAERRYFYEGNRILPDAYSQVQPDADNYETHDIYLDANDPIDVPTSGYRKDITINSNQGGGTVNYYIIGSVSNCGFAFRIINKANNVDMNFQFNGLERQLYLPNGNYELQLDYYNPCHIDILEFWWSENKMNLNFIEREGKVCYKANELAGGVRVKRIEDFDPVTNKTESTDYKYNLFSDTTLTSGLLISTPQFVHVKTCDGRPRGCFIWGISSQSCYPLTTQAGSYVFYTDVTTIKNNNGFVEDHFSFNYDGDLTGISDDKAPLTPPLSRDYIRGNLIYSKYYDKNNILLKKIFNTYSYMDENSGNSYLKQVSAYRVQVESDPFNSELTSYTYTGCWNEYKLYGRFKFLKSTLTTDYHGQDSITTTKIFDYDEQNASTYVSKESSLTSTNKKNETYYKYSFDDPTTFNWNLTALESSMKTILNTRNYLSPLEASSFAVNETNRSFLNGSKYIFDNFNEGLLEFSKFQHFYSQSLSVSQNYTKYDDLGNLLSSNMDQAPSVCYIWGYGGNNLIAVVKNADYSTVEAVLGGTGAVQTFRNIASPTPIQLSIFLGTLRNSVNLKNAQVETYTYYPLIGLTSMTDAKGQTTYYEYDRFQRLMNVKDKDGNIIKHTDYHYQGQ